MARTFGASVKAEFRAGMKAAKLISPTESFVSQPAAFTASAILDIRAPLSPSGLTRWGGDFGGFR